MIREFSDEDTPIFMYGRAKDDGQDYTDISDEEELKICGKPVISTIGILLPMSFGANGTYYLKHREVYMLTYCRHGQAGE